MNKALTMKVLTTKALTSLTTQRWPAQVLAAMTVMAGIVPDPAPAAPPGLAAPAALFISWMKWIGIIAGLFGFGMCALMMILGRRNRSSMAVDGAAGLPWVLGGLSTLTLAAGIVGVLVS